MGKDLKTKLDEITRETLHHSAVSLSEIRAERHDAMVRVLREVYGWNTWTSENCIEDGFEVDTWCDRCKLLKEIEEVGGD